MPRSRWALPFLVLFAPHGGSVELDEVHCEIQLGALGSASIPLELITRVSTRDWPWFAGVGVRIGRGVVGFISKSGRAVLIELAQPVQVRAPLRWSTQRIAVRVDDTQAFMVALAYRRTALAGE